MRSRRWSSACAMVGCAVLGAPAALAAEQWRLMARHGECFEVATLKRKVPDLGTIADPDGFVAFMRQKGFEVSASRTTLPNGKMQEVKVPAKELALIFVTPELCRSQESR